MSAKNREDGVPQQELERFARFLLPKIQAFYQSEEGQRLFEEWKEKSPVKERLDGKKSVALWQRFCFRKTDGECRFVVRRTL